MKTFARFATVPIGAGLVAGNGGLLLASNVAGLSTLRTARGDIGRSSGVVGFEVALWGDAALVAMVGLVQPDASLDTFIGADAAGIGWRLDTGQVFAGGAVVVSGLPVIGKQEIVGVRVNLDDHTVEFFRGPTLVHSMVLPPGVVTWSPAVALAAAEPGTLVAAINAGQWPAATPAGTWAPAPAAAAPVRLADMHWLSAPGDILANARYEGLIADGGFDTFSVLHFWPWGDAPIAVSMATLRVMDPEGRVDGLLTGSADGLPVKVSAAPRTGSLADAQGVGRYVLAGAEVEDDMRRTLTLADAHDDLGELLNPAVFLPNIPQLAWQPQPLVIGAVANIPALPANGDATALFLADAPVHGISVVRDRGDAMEAGTWVQSADKHQLLMASPSIGPVTADGSSLGLTSGEPTPATLQQFLGECFRRIGKSAWASGDAAAIDAATGYAGIGYSSRDAVDAWTAVTAALASYGAWLWRDGNGVLRIARVVAPEAVADADIVLELEESQLLRDVVRVNDGAPALSRRMGYRPNAYMHGPADLVTDLEDVPPAMRERLMSPHWGQVYSDRAISPIYRHADTAPARTSLFWREQDAYAELDRVLGIYAVARASYRWEVRDLKLNLTPGDAVRAKYSRYTALASGRKLLVRGAQRNEITGATVLTLWG